MGGGLTLSGLTFHIPLFCLVSFSLQIKINLKFWVALFVIIYVRRASGMSYFGTCPETRVNLGLVWVSVWYNLMTSCLLPNVCVPTVVRTLPVLKCGNRRIEEREIKWECDGGRRESLAGYHGTWAQQCCISIKYHWGSLCFWSSSLQLLADQHLAGEAHQPQKRDIPILSNTLTNWYK